MSSGAVTGTGGSVKLRKGLVMAQVAFSFLLLVGAGLFVKTLVEPEAHQSRLSRTSINLITFQMDAAAQRLLQCRACKLSTRSVLDRPAPLPGVQAASLRRSCPVLAGGEWDSTMGVEGHQANSDGEDMQAFMNAISPGYWNTMGTTAARRPRFRSAAISDNERLGSRS